MIGVHFGLNRCYLNSVYQMLKALALHRNRVARGVIDKFNTWKSPFADESMQQDAHECLLSIIDQLADNKDYGTITSNVACALTGDASSVHEPFFALSLPVEVALTEAVAKFEAPETMSGDNVWMSPKALQRQITPIRTTKTMRVKEWPNGCRVFHFQRFCPKTNTKNTTSINIPRRIPGHTLVAAVVHLGHQADWGHYVCVCLSNEDKNSWWICDDKSVTSMSSNSEMLENKYISQSYIVAYVRDM